MTNYLSLDTQVDDLSVYPEIPSFSPSVGSFELSSPTYQLPGAGRSRLLFIDSGVQHYEQLIQAAKNTKVFVLNVLDDGIQQISQVLSNYDHDVTSVHIVSHGSVGSLQLGSTQLSSANLDGYAAQLSAWSSALKPDADLLFYGCNTAADSEGYQFIEQISQLTEADVAGSNNWTGSSAASADWNLEVHVGVIESETIFDQDAIASYGFSLDITAGLVGHWQLDETSGSTAENSVVGGNSGKLQKFSNTSKWVPGKINGGLSFDGINDRVSIKHYDALNTANSLTLAAWIRVNPFEFDNWDGIITKGTKDASYSMQLWSDGSLRFGANVLGTAGGVGGGEWNSHSKLTADVWHHVAVTYDGTAVRFYIDGKQDSNVVTTNIHFGTNTQALMLGADLPGGDEFFDGVMDDVRVYNRALDATEVGQLAGTSTANPGVIGLQRSNISVNEGSGSASVTVLRTSGSAGTVTVDYQTFDASALATADYIAQTGTLTFGPGVLQQSVTIPIVNDALTESSEVFSLTIDNVTGGATLLAPRTAQITIVDDDTPSPTGLVAHWKLDDGNGTTAVDLVGANNGTLTNGPLWATGPLQGGLEFDGVNDYVEVPDSAGLDITSTITLAAWIKPDAFRSWDPLISKGTATTPYAMQLWHDGSLRFSTNVSSPSGAIGGGEWISNTKMTAGEWYHVAVTYDGTAVRFFINGVQDTNVVTTQLVFGTNDESLTLGGYLPGLEGDELFDGVMDDVRVYNTALSTAEIKALFDLGTPPSSATAIAQTVISGLLAPTAIDWTPNGNKMFIAQKDGIVLVFENGQLLATPFIDISHQVNNNRDRGLLDIAVHPDFPNQPYIYLLFTYEDPIEVAKYSGLAGPDGGGNRAGRLIRVTADAATNYTTAVADSAVVLLGTNSTWQNFNAFVDSTNNLQEPPAGILPDGQNLQNFLAADSTSHTVGSVEFGPDGVLYVSNGDGTSFNVMDPRTVRVQDIDNLSGKILRIDPLTGQGLSSNPFYDGDPDSNRSKVYQYGLRNPFRFNVDPTSGKVYIGDVGWTAWEEVNAAAPGANFGWPYYEGGNGVSLRTSNYQDLAQAQAFYASGQTVVPSLFALSHSADNINAIIMGDVYTGNTYPTQYWGDLFFNDLGQGIVRNISFDTNGQILGVDTFATGAQVVVQMVTGPDGNLYYVDLDDGDVGYWRFA